MNIGNKLYVTNQFYDGWKGGLRFDSMLFKVTKGEKGKVGILKQQKYRLRKIGECRKRFENIKVVVRIRKSMKNRQHNGQQKKKKRTNNDLKKHCKEN